MKKLSTKSQMHFTISTPTEEVVILELQNNYKVVDILMRQWGESNDADWYDEYHKNKKLLKCIKRVLKYYGSSPAKF